MKKTALLNSHLSHLLATLGHTDSFCICDAGLPIANGVSRIDLALTAGIPSFMQTVNAVTTEFFVEAVLIAEEIKLHNPQVHSELLAFLLQLQKEQGNQIQINYVPHSEFKRQTESCKAVVRTGEFTAYANAIFYSGVPF